MRVGCPANMFTPRPRGLVPHLVIGGYISRRILRLCILARRLSFLTAFTGKYKVFSFGRFSFLPSVSLRSECRNAYSFLTTTPCRSGGISGGPSFFVRLFLSWQYPAPAVDEHPAKLPAEYMTVEYQVDQVEIQRYFYDLGHNYKILSGLSSFAYRSLVSSLYRLKWWRRIFWIYADIDIFLFAILFVTYYCITLSIINFIIQTKILFGSPCTGLVQILHICTYLAKLIKWLQLRYL